MRRGKKHSQIDAISQPRRGFYFLSFVLYLISFNLSAEQPHAIPVTSQPLAELLKYPIQSAPATVVSLNRSQLSAQLNAQILNIPVRVGEVVRRGAVLVELDCRDAQLALQQAQSRMQLA